MLFYTPRSKIYAIHVMELTLLEHYSISSRFHMRSFTDYNKKLNQLRCTIIFKASWHGIKLERNFSIFSIQNTSNSLSKLLYLSWLSFNSPDGKDVLKSIIKEGTNETSLPFHNKLAISFYNSSNNVLNIINFTIETTTSIVYIDVY